MSDTYTRAEDLVMGQRIETEDGEGNIIQATVYRLRRVSGEEGMLATSAGEVRVPLGKGFKILPPEPHPTA